MSEFYDQFPDALKALKLAIDRAGGKRHLGSKLSPPITGEAISMWLKTRIPYRRVLQVASLAGIYPERLRPDLVWECAGQFTINGENLEISRISYRSSRGGN